MPKLHVKKNDLNKYVICKNFYFPIYVDDICNLTDIKQEECINYVRDNFNANINICNRRFLIYFINKYEAEKVLEWVESLFLAYELNK